MSTREREAMAVLGYFFLQNNRPAKAAALFAALNVLYPDDPRTVTSLALAQVREGRAERALQTLERLALLGFADDVFHLLRAQALTALERREEASAAMQAYLAQRALVTQLPSLGQR